MALSSTHKYPGPWSDPWPFLWHRYRRGARTYPQNYDSIRDQYAFFIGFGHHWIVPVVEPVKIMGGGAVAPTPTRSKLAPISVLVLEEFSPLLPSARA